MKNMIDYNVVFSNLYNVMAKDEFRGYDPYDFLNSPLFRHKNRFFSITGTQFFKYLPINMRPFLKIKKKHNLKTLVLTVFSILNYFKANSSNKKMENDLNNILNIILSCALRDYGLSWSRIDYDYFSSTGIQKKTSSIIFLDAFVGHMFIKLYEYYKDKKYLDYANQVGEFLLNVEKYNKDDMTCFYYTTTIKDRIFNASAYASAFLAMLYYHTHNDEYLSVAKRGLNYVVNGQNQNGSWYYGVSSNGKLLPLIDYHQGFILDSLKLYLEYIESNETYDKSLRDGLDFYKNFQFLPNGISLFRYPTKWPIDIHNQAQGIITFSNAGDIDEIYSVFAKKILNWTVNNMFDHN